MLVPKTFKLNPFVKNKTKHLHIKCKTLMQIETRARIFQKFFSKHII